LRTPAILRSRAIFDLAVVQDRAGLVMLCQKARMLWRNDRSNRPVATSCFCCSGFVIRNSSIAFSIPLSAFGASGRPATI
jgi:hypothetical protein